MPRQRASAILLKADRVLMVRIVDHGRSWWCLPGGTVKAHETPEDAVVREMEEELNLTVIPRRRLYEMSMTYEEGVEIGILVKAAADMLVLGMDTVITEWAWCGLDDVEGIDLKRLLTPS